LLGGDAYEPVEENPMIGWRGASRYYDPKFHAAFALECRALRQVRNAMGLTNVIPMVPFCRTPEEGRRVLTAMAASGLTPRALARRRGVPLRRAVPVYVMCEIPSNVVQADAFLDLFDGMSIGSNDLTQLTLGLDRDSGVVGHVANENAVAVKRLVADVIRACRRRGKYIGICGQAPSDYPDFATFLVAQRIDSVSLNPDTVVRTTIAIARKEAALRRH
jgi:pyruvate,water dikinase